MKQARNTQMAFIVLVMILFSAAVFGQGKTPRIPKGHDFTKIAPGARYKSGELLVRFAPNPDGTQRSNAQIKQILRSLENADLKRGFKLVPGLSVVKLPEGQTVEDALKTFNDTVGILYAEPNYEVEVVSTFPNDTYFDDLWGMHNTGQEVEGVCEEQSGSGTEDADIDAPEAWDLDTGSSDIIVAVIDTGVDYNHVDLDDNMWVNDDELNGDPNVDDDGNGYNDDIYGYDFCTYNQERDSDPMDDHGHGTHCAGTIGAVGNNNEGVVGVCWNVQIMALKFLSSSGRGWTSDAILCVQYATMMGADVMSNSWGGGGYHQGLKDAIDAAGAAGMLFVAAAGNNDVDNDEILHYPSSYDCNNIVAVMATDQNDVRSIWPCYSGTPSSNWGSTSVDIAAPGTNILSCKRGGGYQYMDGTSMATPHVAGACALMWSKSPDLTAQEVKDILLDSVDKVESLEGLCVAEGRLNVSNMILRDIVRNLDSGKWYNTIQGAINDANDYDELVTYPGTYYETVDFNGLPITLRSTDPNDWDVVAATIIDANYTAGSKVVEFSSGEDADSVLEGFTVKNGMYGIYCYSTPVPPRPTPVIRKCIIEDNTTYGVYCNKASPKVFNNKIRNNGTYGVKAVPYFSPHGPPGATPVVKNNWISGQDYGIYSQTKGAFTVSNNTIVDNSTGGIYKSSGTAPTIKNCILWDNGDDLYNCSATYSCIKNGDSGEGNISSDPLFVDPNDPNDPDYHLVSTSPCINAGDPNYEPGDGERDIDHLQRIIGGRVDMGADEVGRVHNINKDLWYLDIQPAIDDASDYDELVAYPYPYYETVDFNGLPITLRSTDPNDWDVVAGTIIDANDPTSGKAVKFTSGEDANSILEGFTITGGKHGIYCYGPSLSPTIRKCIIEDNTTNGVYCYKASPKILNNKIRGNGSHGVHAFWSSSPVIKNNWIHDNNYGIRCFRYSSPTVRNNTIVGNTNKGIYRSFGGSPTISNCILWDNGDDLYGGCSATYSCIEDGDAGTGNISSDPLFVDSDNDDYHLDPNSPCIDVGDPSGDYTGEYDIDGQPRLQAERVDMGADEAQTVHNTTQDKWYANIQDAIDDAGSYSELVAYPGVYYENVDFKGKAITVRSTDPNDWNVVAATIIDANDPTNGTAVQFVSVEDADSVLEGFTVKNGMYGIYCHSTPLTSRPTPVIRKCIIEDNTTHGVYCRMASPKIFNNKIRNNGTYGVKAVPYFSPHGPPSSRPVVKNNWISGQDYGIYSATKSAVTVRNNTIVDNSVGGVYKNSGSAPKITNCIIWDNGDDLFNCSATYSCIEDGDGVSDPNTHNIDDDPLFEDPNNYDYHLKTNSPCIDVGDPNGVYTGEYDIDGDDRVIDIAGKGDGTVDVDMGGDEYKEPD